MKGEMIMEKKDFTKLTKEEIINIITAFREIGGCANSSCNTCLANSSNYTNVESGQCNDTFIDILKTKIYGDETSETIDSITITPETTDINYMISTGYIHDLAAVLTRETKNNLCRANKGCKNCKLNRKNFSTTLGLESCGDAINFIRVLSHTLKMEGDSSITASTKSRSHTCANCGYCNKVGEFLFCTAWKNYTDEDMYCGYHKPIDK